MSSMVLSKPVITNSNDCTHERAGIFDQFIKREYSELCYYAVFSNSDCEGNITVLDVKKETFGSNVTVEFDNSIHESHEKDSIDGVGEEFEDEEFKLDLKKRYGFRTRRLIDHRVQDFDTSMCESSDESCVSEPEYSPPSDDEPYDLSCDNWSVVRRTKRKQNEGTMKTRNSSQKQLLERTIKKEKPSRSNSASETTSTPSEVSSTKVKKKQNETHTPHPIKNKSDQLPNTPPVQKTVVTAVDVPMTSQEVLHKPATKIMKDSPRSIRAFPKRSPNKIRFGYNSTAPKVPEMRPIKRRQLRQTAGRTTPSANPPLSDVSSSSDDETPISTKTRAGMKISRINDVEKPVPVALKSLTPQPLNPPSKQEPIVTNTATVTTGKGLKMVFRRQSVDTNASSIQRSDTERFVSEKAHTKDDVFAPDKMHHVNVKKFARNATNEQAEKQKLECKISTDSNCVDAGSPESVTEGSDENRRQETTLSAVVNESNSTRQKSHSQSAIDEDHTKKKKSKKKRKKERGRSASNASIEEACDADDTAMRLAMELPRHNWLVKHLIKEKKLKAEDDKPLNIARGDTDELTSQVTASDAKHRTITTDTPNAQQESNSTKPDLPESELPPDGAQTRKNTRQEEALGSEDLRNNQNNYSKGTTSMVGIVKPFQHLNMSPANCKGGDASPSRLCIIDEEETQNQMAETSNASACQTKQINIELAACNSDSIVANSNENNPVVIAAPVAMPVSLLKVTSTQKDERMKLPEAPIPSNDEGSSATETTNVVTASSSNEHALIPSRNDVTDNIAKSLPVNSTNTTHTHLPPEKSHTSEGTTENETESEIQISSCFSLALDLTKKVEVKIESNVCTSSNDQPLDLSMKTKTGDTSPKILDLSVKKQPCVSNTTDSPRNNAETPKPKFPDSKPVPSKAVDCMIPMPQISAPRQENTTLNLLKTTTSSIPVKGEGKPSVIVIHDEANASPKNMISNQRPYSMIVESLPSSTSSNLPSPSTSKFTSNPMKRCASLDATRTQIASSEQRKRARMSLDDSRSSTNKPTSAAPSLSTSRQRKIPEIVDNPLPTMPSYTPASVPSVVEKPFVVSRPNAPLVQTERASLYTTVSTQQHIATQVRAPTAFSTSLRPLQYQPSTPTTPSTSLCNGSLVSTKYPQTTEHASKIRAARSRSLQSNNVRAQMVAQAYQPDIANLEPYIKAQQRAVDEKIKELEAIKKQLADASESNKTKSPTHVIGYSYPRPPKQIRQHYNPPVQISMPIPKPVITKTIIHTDQAIISHSPMSHHISAPIQTTQPHMPRQQPVPRPNIVHGAHLKQRPLQPQWRALPATHSNRPRFVVRRPVANGNPPMDSSSVRQMQPPRMMNSQNFPRLTNSSSALPIAPSQLPVPRAYSHSVPGPRLQSVPTPRLTLAQTNTPVYRNGGLTVTDAFRIQLNEPIVIEDDIAYQSGNHRPGFSPSTTHSLKIRRAHSYHPPLSKNQNQWTTPRQTLKTPGSNPPKSKTESCARCGGKAYFLCSGCRKIWYCNKNCQLQDWNTHSSICSG